MQRKNTNMFIDPQLRNGNTGLNKLKGMQKKWDSEITHLQVFASMSPKSEASIPT